MNSKDLFKKELNNLYAINKQINDYFNGSEISFLSEKHQLLLMDYLKFICQCEEETSNILDKLEFNPTNTSDSIVKEITENLNDIVQENIDDEIKSSGYLMSINRLMAYQSANLENVNYLRTDEINFDLLMQLKEEFQQLKNKLFIK